MARERKAKPAAGPQEEAAGAQHRPPRATASCSRPTVIDDIHIKAELGRYRMRGFSLFKKIPTWDDLTFLPGTLTRFVIEGYREKCLTTTVIGPKAKRPLVLDIADLHHRHELRRLVLRGEDLRSRAAPRWPARRPARARAA